MRYFIAIFVLLFFACKSNPEINSNLIYFNSKYIGEPGNEGDEKLFSKSKFKINAKYMDDIILATNHVEINACGEYNGDIVYKNDSIYLVCRLVSDQVCASTSVVKVTYIIKNPNGLKYKFSMRFE